jgi:hypothetical protein
MEEKTFAMKEKEWLKFWEENMEIELCVIIPKHATIEEIVSILKDEYIKYYMND